MEQIRNASDVTRVASGDVDPQVSDLDLSFLEPPTVAGSLGSLCHYDIQELIGRGGCGIVFKAFDQRLHRIVAIKVMTPAMAVTSPARKRFLREARATAAIRHENVVNIYAVEEAPLPFLVMEYIDGKTLQQVLDENGPLELPTICRLGKMIAHGLEAAHQQGLIHRDIKPANILIESGTGQVKLTDFGLARAADDASRSQSGIIAGTPLYMSPEQVQGIRLDQRSDLFSLGSVLYVMCTGRAPFRAPSTLA
ncbi:MAG TPA: serine/threonine protein kinase, partial [Planctomycetaceae bacterium]|nr:serine/threonine protein kinase [Planctomycetaceae bacterium]